MRKTNYSNANLKLKKHLSSQSYRWTDAKTIKMLKGIIEYLKEDETCFERPTLKCFYDAVREKFVPNMKADWRIMKNKMYYLRRLYVRARNWKNKLVKKNNKNEINITARLERLCPFYSLLHQIYGANTNLEPQCLLGIQLTESEHTTMDYESSQNFIPLTVVASFDDYYSLDEHIARDDQRTLLCSSVFSAPYKDINLPYDKDYSFDVGTNTQHGSEILNENWFKFEQQKIELHNELEMRQFRLEENWLELEKDKLKIQLKMNKYAIDKQIEIKKLEIATKERIRLMEFNEADKLK